MTGYHRTASRAKKLSTQLPAHPPRRLAGCSSNLVFSGQKTSLLAPGPAAACSFLQCNRLRKLAELVLCEGGACGELLDRTIAG